MEQCKIRTVQWKIDICSTTTLRDGTTFSASTYHFPPSLFLSASHRSLIIRAPSYFERITAGDIVITAWRCGGTSMGPSVRITCGSFRIRRLKRGRNEVTYRSDSEKE